MLITLLLLLASALLWRALDGSFPDAGTWKIIIIPLSLVIAWFVCLIAIAANSHEVEPIMTETSLVSMERQAAVNGSFFLGCGTVRGNACYFYFEQIAPNAYDPKSVWVSDARIIEDGGNKLVTLTAPSESWSWWCWIRTYHIASPRKYIFHIPKGSVKPIFRP